MSRRSAPLQQLQVLWSALAVRERRLLGAAALLVGLAVLWWVGLQPALRTLREAESQHRVLDAQLQHMQDLASQATALQALPRLRADDSLQALEATVRQGLGPQAQLQVVGNRATVILRGVPAQALAQWLAQVRSNARVLPQEARLTLNPTRTGWDGSLVLGLPPP